jgi:hypothetical protein
MVGFKSAALTAAMGIALVATATGHKQQRQKTADELFIAFVKTHPLPFEVDSICEEKDNGLSREVMMTYCSAAALARRSTTTTATEPPAATKPQAAVRIESRYVGAVWADDAEMRDALAAAGILTQTQADGAYGELRPVYKSASYDGDYDRDVVCESHATRDSCTDGVTTTYTECQSDGSCTGGTFHNSSIDGYELVAGGTVVWRTPLTSAGAVVNALVDDCGCGHRLADPSLQGTLDDYMKTEPPALNVKMICDNGFGPEHRPLTAEELQKYCK